MSNVLTRTATFVRSWGPQLGNPEYVEECVRHEGHTQGSENLAYLGSGRGSYAYEGPDGLDNKSWHLDEWDDYRPIPDGQAVIDYANNDPERVGRFLVHTSEWVVGDRKVFVQEYVEPFSESNGSTWDLTDEESEAYYDKYSRLPREICDDFHGGNFGVNPRDPDNFILFDI